MSYDILIVDDEPDICYLVSGILDDEGYSSRTANSSITAIDQMNKKRPNLVILDVWLGESERDGLKILEKIKQDHPFVPVIMFSGHSTIEIAVQAIQDGAYDFFEKPFNVEKLLITINRALELYKLKEENEILKEDNKDNFIFSGKSPSLNQLKKSIEYASKSDSKIFLHGKKNVGKAHIARSIHNSSSRSNYPFIEIKPIGDEKKLDVEIFGMDISSSSDEHSVGLIEKANTGTVFINNISKFPLNIQKKLSNIIQKKAFKRIGSNEWIDADIRFIASSSEDIFSSIKRGDIYEDFYYRISNNSISVPSLFDRKLDIPYIINDYLDYLSNKSGNKKISLSEEVIVLLQSHEWPDNFKQLFNVLDWLQFTHNGFDGFISSSMLPEDLKKTSPFSESWNKTSGFISLTLKDARDAFERDYLLAQVNRFGGNISQTAKFIGMERSALHRKLKSLGLSDCSGDTYKRSNAA